MEYIKAGRCRLYYGRTLQLLIVATTASEATPLQYMKPYFRIIWEYFLDLR